MRSAALLCILTFASITQAQSVEEQIRAEVARYVSTINAGDPAAVADLYLDHARTSTVGDGNIRRGWPSIAQLLRDVYASVATIRMTVDSVTVLQLGPDAAIAVFRYHWALGRAGDVKQSGAMTLAYTRTPRGWRVAHDHTSILQSGLSAVPHAAAITDSGPSSPRRQTISCAVTRIVDGDTIDCSRVGRIRLIGMDTPEANQPPFGAHATKALADVIPVGTTVQLEPDVEARDRYNRVLAYVWVGRTMVNWQMVRDGWAVLLTYPPNVQYVEAFADAERRARDEKRGLWATGGFDCRPADHRARRCD